MNSLRLIVDGGYEVPLGATADGQAWIKAIEANSSIGFLWKTEGGVEQGASEPLEDHMRRNTRGDFMIKILGAGSMRIERCELPKDQ